MERDGLSPGEVLLVAAAGLVLMLAATVWCGAAVAAALFGERWQASLAEAMAAAVALP